MQKAAEYFTKIFTFFLTNVKNMIDVMKFSLKYFNLPSEALSWKACLCQMIALVYGQLLALQNLK
jgi:hypothetical protein